MNVIEEIDPKYYEQDYRNPVYIFHGSRVLVPVLKAHQAVCKGGHDINNKNAVYGSSMFIGAIPYAFKNILNHCAIGSGPDDLTMKIYDGVIPEDDYGYVYVCDAKTFRNPREDCQFFSEEDVVPIAVIKVYYRDYKECFVYVEDNYPREM